MAAAIEVVSDVVCPWCFIGKRRVEKALALLGRQDVRLDWKAYQLNPSAPKVGMDRRTYRIRKFGSQAYAQQLEAAVAAAGAEDGIHFRFDRIEKIPNTFDAHRLIWLAGQDGAQDAVVERLFQAYFIEAEDVGNHDVLQRIGIAAGLDPGKVKSLLDSGLGRSEVTADESHAREMGVDGVPSFFVDGEPITSGAQKPERLAAFLGPALSSGLQQRSGL